MGERGEMAVAARPTKIGHARLSQHVRRDACVEPGALPAKRVVDDELEDALDEGRIETLGGGQGHGALEHGALAFGIAHPLPAAGLQSPQRLAELAALRQEMDQLLVGRIDRASQLGAFLVHRMGHRPSPFAQKESGPAGGAAELVIRLGARELSRPGGPRNKSRRKSSRA